MSEAKKGKRYKSSIASCQYVTSKGIYVHFVGGKAIVTDPAIIEELDKEIASNHPHIKLDDKPDVEVTEPLAALEAKFRAKFMAEQQTANAAALSHANDLGNTGEQKLTPASSVDIAAVTANGVVSPQAVPGLKIAIGAAKTA